MDERWIEGLRMSDESKGARPNKSRRVASGLHRRGPYGHHDRP
jgi:hypothetical protein